LAGRPKNGRPANFGLREVLFCLTSPKTRIASTDKEFYDCGVIAVAFARLF